VGCLPCQESLAMDHFHSAARPGPGARGQRGMRPFGSALSPGLLSRTVVRSDLFFTKLLERGLRSFQAVHSSSEGANGVRAPQPNLVCGTTPARQARLKERGGPDAPAL